MRLLPRLHLSLLTMLIPSSALAHGGGGYELIIALYGMYAFLPELLLAFLLRLKNYTLRRNSAIAITINFVVAFVMNAPYTFHKNAYFWQNLQMGLVLFVTFVVTYFICSLIAHGVAGAYGLFEDSSNHSNRKHDLRE
jgi:putative flippase GtrA